MEIEERIGSDLFRVFKWGQAANLLWIARSEFVLPALL